MLQVREWCLGGTARCYRQTIMLSSFAAPDMNAAVQRFCCSHAGKLRLKQAQEGVLAMVVPQVCVLAAVLCCVMRRMCCGYADIHHKTDAAVYVQVRCTSTGTAALTSTRSSRCMLHML